MFLRKKTKLNIKPIIIFLFYQIEVSPSFLSVSRDRLVRSTPIIWSKHSLADSGSSDDNDSIRNDSAITISSKHSMKQYRTKRKQNPLIQPLDLVVSNKQSSTSTTVTTRSLVHNKRDSKGESNLSSDDDCSSTTLDNVSAWIIILIMNQYLFEL